MNAIAWIILLTILLDSAIHFGADVLNLKQSRKPLPRDLRDWYDPARYRKAQLYLRANTHFDWISALFGLALTLAFWFGGGFPWLDAWLRRFDWGPIVTGIVFMGGLVLAKGALTLPFNLYHTFVIEERFGFNKTTWAIFCTDLLKGLAVTMVLGGPLLAGILVFFQYAGAHAWWLCWLAVTVYMLVVQFVAPRWIMPLFNTFTPLEEGELKTAIMDYATSIGFSLQNIFVMDGSRRSGKSNAFFTGFGRHKRIVLYDTLIAQHTVAELVAVLAHEMGHYKKKHIQQALVLSTMQSGVMFYLLSFFISYQGLFDAFYMPQPSIYAGLIFFGLLYSPMAFVVGILIRMRSRHNEFAADRFAAQTTGNAAAMIATLKKLPVHNLSHPVPHPLFVFLNYSHPPVPARIAALKALQ